MLCLIRAKACKICGGDLSVECDIYGVYIQCIQCGANYSREDVLLLKARKTVKALSPKELAAAGRRT